MHILKPGPCVTLLLIQGNCEYLIILIASVNCIKVWFLWKTDFNTVNSRFKKDLKLQIHLHKAFFWTTGF